MSNVDNAAGATDLLLPPELRGLAAQSASNSLLRTRLLFDYKKHPIPQFQPQLQQQSSSTTTTKSSSSKDNNNKNNDSSNNNDPIYEAALARRKRMLLGSSSPPSSVVQEQQPRKKKQQKPNNAIVVSTVQDDNDNENNIGNIARSGPSSMSNALALPAPTKSQPFDEEEEAQTQKPTGSGILVKSDGGSKTSIPTPKWHAPWKLSTVLSSHLGWVRSIAFDPTNTMFATGSADRTIKIWNFPKASVGANDALQLTLTGHIGPVRGMAFSDRHPYLFTCGEDKQVKCWDLETNQVIRHYHGHLSGVFCLNLHPTLDILVTGGRDAVARVWDMRTKTQIHCLTGHDHTVASVITKSTNPQIITGSHDTTVKLWDIIAGKCITTLTHHMKSVRTMVRPTFENTFLTGSTDCIKKWTGRHGKFIQSWYYDQKNHMNSSGSSDNSSANVLKKGSIVHTMSCNDDGVVVSGNDDGVLNFWDYNTGYNYQNIQSQVQPGSLDAENAIFTSCFDLTGTRLITGEADKTIKIWKEDTEASELSHPIDTPNWRKNCIKYSKQRY